MLRSMNDLNRAYHYKPQNNMFRELSYQRSPNTFYDYERNEPFVDTNKPDQLEEKSFQPLEPMEQGGTGLGDAFGLASLLQSSAGAALSNMVTEQFDRNPNRQPIEAGEKHMVLPTPYGYSVANFAGPGTKIEKRLQRGDLGVDGPQGIDEAAKQHDVDYYNAKTVEDVRLADQKFIQKVDASSAPASAKSLVRNAMKAKIFAEDLGVMEKGSFAGIKNKQEKPFQQIRRQLVASA